LADMFNVCRFVNCQTDLGSDVNSFWYKLNDFKFFSRPMRSGMDDNRLSSRKISSSVMSLSNDSEKEVNCLPVKSNTVMTAQTYSSNSPPLALPVCVRLVRPHLDRNAHTFDRNSRTLWLNTSAFSIFSMWATPGITTSRCDHTC